MTTQKFETVDEYLSLLPEKTRDILEELRTIIRHAAPQAKECISYNMPAFKQNGVLVYYAAFRDHVSLFPTGSGIAAFKDELLNYKTSKGTIQFSIEKGIPVDLVKRIVAFRVKEDSLKNAKKKNLIKNKDVQNQ